MSETVKVQSLRTGNVFAVTFQTPAIAFEWIQAHDYAVVECSDAVQWEAQMAAEAATVHCSICDGIGHGQPGYGPCPLEDRGWMDTFEEEARTFGAF